MTLRPRIFFFALAAAVAICFVCLRSAETQSSLRRITNTTDEGISINPSISGDGRIIGFESTEDLAGAGGTNHFRAIRANISADPPTFFQMGRTRTVAPGISQDGSRITFASKDDPLGTNADGNSEIFVFNGANLLQVTNTTPGNPANRITEGNFQPSISDDGRFIAFSSNRNPTSQNGDGNLEVFVYDSAVSSFTQLTNSTGVVGFSDAKISGDGSAIACIRDPGTTASTNRDLLRINRTSAAPTVLALNVVRLAMTYGRAISDDGTRVTYSAETATNSTQVFYYDGRIGNVNRQVTTLGTRVSEVPLHPTISGDGRRIAFATRRALTGFSNSDASVELYTYDIPTGAFARITNVPNNDADCFDGASAACEVVSSLNDDGATVVFNFPRALSGAVTSGLENESEIYATGLVARPPFGTLTSILNQASLGHEPSPIKAVAPNSIAAAFGSVLANTTQQSQKLPDGTFPTNVGGTTVTVNGRAAQIFFVSPERVHFLVPSQTEIGNAEVVITNADGFASRGSVPILLAAPGIFTKTGDGIGEGMIVNADTLAEGPFDPSSGNLRLLIFSTGVRNGVIRTVNIGGRVLTPEAVNQSPEMPGLDEVIVRVPADLRGAGNVTLFIQADGRDSNPVTVRFLGDPTRNVVINEVLADPPDGIAGDANHDGVRDGTDDEFVELVNGTSAEVISLGGWTIRTRATGSTTETTRFTFALGTSLPAGEAIVVFGGGTFNPADTVFGCAQVVKATTTAGLSLTNSGVTILLRDASGNLITEFSYGGSTGLEGDNNQSLTRSPDVTGTFVQHTTAGGPNPRRYSPGLKIDGTPFGNCPSILTTVTISPPSATVDVGQIRQFTAQAFDQYGRAMTGVNITFSSDNTNVATVESVTTDPITGVATANVKGQNPGVANITASATDGSNTVNSTPAVLTVSGPALSINDVSQSEGNAGTSTFTFTVSLSTPAAAPVTFDIATQDNTATSASGDYVARSLTSQTIATGQQTYTFDVTVNGDVVMEPTETFFVNVSNVSGASVTDAQGVGTIANDDIAGVNVIINEVDVDQAGTDTLEFVELYDGGVGNTSLTGLVVVFFNGGNDQSYGVFDLDGFSTDANGYFTLGNAALPGVDLVFNNGLLQNGADAVALYIGSAPDFPTGTPVSTTNLLDALVYETGQADDAGLLVLLNAGQPQVDESADGDSTTVSMQRCPNGTGGARNTSTYALRTPTADSQNTCAAPAPSLSINNVSLAEGDSGAKAFTFTVTLSTVSSQTVTVNFATADGTATLAGNDYQSNSGMLTFAPGDTSEDITVLVNGDTLDEANENFFVNLSGAVNAVVLDSQGQGTITDNDPTPSLSINDLSIAEGDSGTTAFTFTVTLSSASGQTVTVNFATADNTASSASDYQSNSGTLTFIPGDTEESITVLVNGDGIFESNETFLVNLSGATNASISDAQGQGTITNDDAAPPTPTFFITNVNVTEGNSGTVNAVFDVSLSPASGVTVQVDYQTVDGSATVAGNDYQPTSGTLIFNPGDGPKQITVLVNGDTLVEPNETFTVHLSNATNGAGIGTPDGTGTIQNDDAADLVISQTYPGGGNGSATFTHDFIELFNQGTTTVNFAVTPYSVQFLSTTASTWAKIDLTSGTIAPGGYFLIQGTSGGPIGAPLPTPDASGSLNLTTTSGKVALVVGTTLLTGNCPGDDGSVPFNPVDGTVVDFVGYGGTSATANHCYEGSGPAPFTSGVNTIADFRKLGGCQDTNDNAADFVLATPSPRNTNSPINDCTAADLEITKTDSPDPVIVGSNVTYTITVTNHGPATANSVVVTDNLPANVTFVSCTAPGGTCNVGSGNSRTITYASIAAGGSETITLVATANGPAGTPISNMATVNSSTADSNSPNNSATATTDVNDPAPPDLTIGDITQVETNAGTTTFTFTVSLSSPALAGGVSFTVNTADGTTNPATAGSDYVAIVNSSGSIAEGNSSTTVDVLVNGDTVFEPNETFFVNITGVTGATVSDPQGLGTITNDDAAPTLAIADASITEGNSGTSLMTFTVTLTGTSQSTVSVDYATADSSATLANSDYDSASGTLNFVSGDTSETFTVTIHGDVNAEGDEMFFVNLSGASGATISDSQALGVIFLDDPLSIAAVNTAYSENFDVLAQSGVSATTPAAWTRAESGTAANTTYTANNGSSTTGDTYSYGSTTLPADRALGGLRTGSLVPTVGAFYRNDTGSTINSLQISYTGEEWRLGNAGRTDRLDFQYSTDATSLTTGTWTDVNTLDFTTPNTATVGAKDGNDAANRTAISNTITGLSIAAGATFWIRWTDLDATGSDDGLAVDDFSITAGLDTPALSINDVTQVETNSGTTTFNFTVSLTSPAPPGGVSFTINTADGTTNPANAPSDYSAIVNGSGSIAQNGTSTTVSVTVNGDVDVEPNETFFVNLTGVTGATVTDAQGLGTITNDDAAASTTDLSVTKTDALDPVAIGNDITYTITVTNGGPNVASNAQLSDTVPTSTTFRSITAPVGWTCPTQPAVGGTGAINCSNANFGVGSAVFTLVVRVGTAVADGTIITNTASVSSSTTESNPGNESAMHTTTVKQPFLVISQVYGGGGNASATYTNDFIEIFNRGTTTVDFSATNYSVQYAAATSNFTTNKTDITSGTIAPGQYFLIQQASGGANGVALPTPDATGSIAMSATAGKVALVLGTTALTGSGCPFGAAIVDFLGYGTTANCSETAPIAMSGTNSNARSAIRTVSCTDTNNNSSDFSNPTTSPTARNSATTLPPCP